MVTFEQRVTEQLVASGLFPDQAGEILSRAKVDLSLKAMVDRWNETTEDYPDVVFTALWLSIERIALQWIDANAPQAWFRPLFAE